MQIEGAQYIIEDDRVIALATDPDLDQAFDAISLNDLNENALGGSIFNPFKTGTSEDVIVIDEKPLPLAVALNRARISSYKNTTNAFAVSLDKHFTKKKARANFNQDLLTTSGALNFNLQNNLDIYKFLINNSTNELIGEVRLVKEPLVKSKVNVIQNKGLRTVLYKAYANGVLVAEFNSNKDAKVGVKKILNDLNDKSALLEIRKENTYQGNPWMVAEKRIYKATLKVQYDTYNIKNNPTVKGWLLVTKLMTPFESM